MCRPCCCNPFKAIYNYCYPSPAPIMVTPNNSQIYSVAVRSMPATPITTPSHSHVRTWSVMDGKMRYNVDEGK